MKTLLTLTTLGSLLAGCAIHIERQADAGQTSTDHFTVVTGRINYVVDGQPVAYRMTAPAWPAPPVMALHLTSGDPHAFPQPDDDGSFRWRVAPGAYVLSNIGSGGFFAETQIAWPDVLMCVPAAPGATVYLGHLRLLGTRYAKPVTLSTGKSEVSRGVRYQLEVADEEGPAAAGGRVKRLLEVRPGLPAGDRLVQRWRQDAAGLRRELCGEAFAGAAPTPLR